MSEYPQTRIHDASRALAAAVEDAVREFQNTTGCAVERLDIVTCEARTKSRTVQLMEYVRPVFTAP